MNMFATNVLEGQDFEGGGVVKDEQTERKEVVLCSISTNKAAQPRVSEVK